MQSGMRDPLVRFVYTVPLRNRHFMVFKGWASVISRIVAKVQETNVYMTQRILNREAKLLFDANGIKYLFSKSAPAQTVKYRSE